MNHRSSRSVGILITLLAAASACGGGSDDEVTGLACGPGTREDAGRCVPDGSGGAGGTAGSGGGTGGTTGGGSGGAGAPGGGAGMAGASTGGSAGASAGGAAGASGSAGTSAGASGAGAGGGGTGGSAAGTGGAGNGGAGNGGAAGAGLQDDPCPSEPVIDFNASDTCGGTKPADLKVCVDQYAATLAGSDHPFVIRTPSHPGVGTGCKAYCGWGYAWVESFKIAPGLSTAKKYFRVTGGGKGWQWYVGAGEKCPTSVPKSGCQATWDTSDPRLTIFTTDPDAPSVNIRVEVSTQPFSCP